MIRKWEEYHAPTIGYVIWNKYRCKGYGNQIVNELVDKAYQKGFYDIKASVHYYNKASMKALRNRGFRFIGQVKENDSERDFLWFLLDERVCD
jgi:RimJ/RimL family protein N-acetyltransferase